MRKLFLAAAGLFFAASAQADTPPATAATPATPVVTTGDYTTGAPARRGLFARLRGRTMLTRYSYTPTTTVAPTTAAPTTPAPMPMGKVSSDTPHHTPSGVVQTSGTTAPMPTTGMVTTAAYTVPMTTTRPMMRLGMFRTMRYFR
jgi:hypothetical protein